MRVMKMLVLQTRTHLNCHYQMHLWERLISGCVLGEILSDNVPKFKADKNLWPVETQLLNWPINWHAGHSNITGRILEPGNCTSRHCCVVPPSASTRNTAIATHLLRWYDRRNTRPFDHKRHHSATKQNQLQDGSLGNAAAEHVTWTPES